MYNRYNRMSKPNSDLQEETKTNTNSSCGCGSGMPINKWLIIIPIILLLLYILCKNDDYRSNDIRTIRVDPSLLQSSLESSSWRI